MSSDNPLTQSLVSSGRVLDTPNHKLLDYSFSPGVHFAAPPNPALPGGEEGAGGVTLSNKYDSREITGPGLINVCSA